MRMIELPSGRTVRIGVRHAELTPGDHYFTLASRKTEAFIEGTDFGASVATYCSRKDHFDKRTGRLLVARKMNTVLNAILLDRKDRGVIFDVIYQPQKAEKYVIRSMKAKKPKAKVRVKTPH